MVHCYSTPLLFCSLHCQMAALSFYSNWPSSHHYAAATVPPPPELLPFHDNFTIPDSSYYNHFSPTNLPIPKRIKYPVLSSSFNPPITTVQQPSSPPLPLPELTFTHEYDSNPMVSNQFCYEDQFMMNPVDPTWNQPDFYYSYISYPFVPDVGFIDQMPPQLQETYDCGGSMVPTFGIGQMKEIGNGGGGGKISPQSMAARVRRRKISERTSELGKLVPGGHRMTTAEMFQAAFKYIKFLQAQVGVLQLMQSSPGIDAELHSLLTSSVVQEKLYAAGKCIVTQTLAEKLVDDLEGTRN